MSHTVSEARLGLLDASFLVPPSRTSFIFREENGKKWGEGWRECGDVPPPLARATGFFFDLYREGRSPPLWPTPGKDPSCLNIVSERPSLNHLPLSLSQAMNMSVAAAPASRVAQAGRR